MALRNIALKSFTVAAVVMAQIPSLQAQPFSAAEVGEQQRFAEFKKRAETMGVKLERDQDKTITIMLPPGMPDLPGYSSATDAKGWRVVRPSGDSLYRDCMAGAKARLVFGIGGSLSPDVGAVLGSAAAYGSSLLDVRQCITDHRERLLDALNGLALDRDLNGIKVGIASLEDEAAARDVKISYQGLQIDGIAAQLSALEGTVINGFEKTFKKTMAGVATKADLEKLLNEKIALFRKRVEEYIQQSNEERANAERKQARLDEISLMGTGLNVVVDLAFPNDAPARNSLKNAVNGYVKLAQIAIMLSSASGVPAFFLVLSAAGVMNDMMGSMGRMGPSFEQTLLHEMSQLRGTLEKTRAENARAL